MAAAIVSALVGAALQTFQGYMDESNLAKAKQDLEILVGAIGRYQAQTGKFLTGNDLKPLLGKTLQELPIDPWGSPYLFDGGLGVVGSATLSETGEQARSVMVQYTTYVAVQKVRFKGGGFGKLNPGQELHIYLSKPFEVPAGLEDKVADDFVVVLDGEVPIPVPASTFGFRYLAGSSVPNLGRVVLRATNPNDEAPFIPGGSRVTFSFATAALQEVSFMSGEAIVDPTRFTWGTESSLDANGNWTGARINQ